MAMPLFIRVMLALLVALWSPAWCCCMQKAVASTHASEPTCHAAVHESAEPAPPPCRSNAPADRHSAPAPHPDAPCACAASPVDKPAPADAVPAPAPDALWFPDLPEPLAAALPPVVREGWAESAAPPPASTLLRLHCALLV